MAARLVKADQQVMLFTHNGMAVRFDESKVRPMGRTARGVKGVTLKDENDYIVGCEVVNGDETILVVCENGFGKRSHVEDFRQTNRGGVGVRSIITSERNGNVVGALCVDEDGMVMMSSTGQTVRISMKDLRVMGRNTQGVRLVNLRENGNVVAIQKLEGADQVNGADEEQLPIESAQDVAAPVSEVPRLAEEIEELEETEELDGTEELDETEEPEEPQS